MFVGVITPTTELIVAYNLKLPHMHPFQISKRTCPERLPSSNTFSRMPKFVCRMYAIHTKLFLMSKQTSTILK